MASVSSSSARVAHSSSLPCMLAGSVCIGSDTSPPVAASPSADVADVGTTPELALADTVTSASSRSEALRRRERAGGARGDLPFPASAGLGRRATT
jgi:hypothetical protein